MICHTCKQFRNKFYAPVKDSKDNTIGYLCKKCCQKAYTKDKPADIGWKRAFKNLERNITNQLFDEILKRQRSR